jgi:hypothetical protein
MTDFRHVFEDSIDNTCAEISDLVEYKQLVVIYHQANATLPNRHYFVQPIFSQFYFNNTSNSRKEKKRW